MPASTKTMGAALVPEPRNLTEIAEQAATAFQAEQARQFIDCAINLAMTSMPTAAVVRLLRDHADILEEYE